MRFLHIDRVLEVVRGERIRGLKTFPLSEECLNGHFTRQPLVPGVMLIEAMAQIAGVLVICSHDFRISCVISLIEDVEVPAALQPGATVELHGEILQTNKNGSLCSARIDQEGETIARGGRFIFPHFPSARPGELAEQFRRYGWLDGAGERGGRM